MALDSAPFMVIFFLYYFENKWINLKKSNLYKSRSFTNTFPFIDDLAAINDNGLFEKHISKKSIMKN